MITNREGTNLENRIEELEVDLRIAQARAELALDFVVYLCDELGRSGVINWTADDLKRQFLIDKDYTETAIEFARLDLVTSDGEEIDMHEAVGSTIRDLRERTRLRAKIRDEIRHERDPS